MTKNGRETIHKSDLNNKTHTNIIKLENATLRSCSEKRYNKFNSWNERDSPNNIGVALKQILTKVKKLLPKTA